MLGRWLKKLFASRVGRFVSGKSPADDKPITSLVILLTAPRYLEAEILIGLVNRAWGLELGTTDPDATEFVVGESPVFIVKTAADVFLVNNFPIPYVEDAEQQSQQLRDLRVRKAFAEHRAWLSVDLLNSDKEEPHLNEAYCRIGRLVAALLDEESLAVYCPSTNEIVVVDAGLEDRLRSSDVLKFMGRSEFAPVLEVSADHPLMQHAVAEARRRWPEFVAAFEQRQADQPFLVKAPFREGDHTEFMWLSVDAIENGTIFGHLKNDPVHIARLRCDSPVQAAEHDVNDWLYSLDEKPAGAFTVAAIAQIEKESNG